jgi:tetratricopeptide (TPR) repeat protein
MRSPTRILEILRDFVEVDRLVRGLARRHRAQGLRFPELAALIRDDESSVLFRLKERTHAVFRGPGGVMRGSTHREALFDLAVGSLFHEAMKLRENLYQREVYGPRVRELHSEAGEESKALFDEFEKMLGAVDQRLDEGVRELETLARQTADQLRLLIAELNDDGAVRFVIEQPDEVEAVFGLPLDALLEEMYGSVARGFESAGRAYLSSGAFEAARDCFARALEQTEADPAIERLLAYAEGMHAYISRDYASSVRHLAVWADRGAPEPPLVALARDAVSSVVQLADGEHRTQVAREASALLDRLGGPAVAIRKRHGAAAANQEGASATARARK